MSKQQEIQINKEHKRRSFSDQRRIRALLIYPKTPKGFWSYHYIMDVMGFKSLHPPLGLLTVASLFPRERYELRLVDENIETLEDADIEWADFAFLSAMISQKDSLIRAARRCQGKGVPTIAGGPYPTTYWQEIDFIDHFVLGEAETHFGSFLRDLEEGTAKPVYFELKKPASDEIPVPAWDLVKMDQYHSAALQFSRGCPFTCEFCDIPGLYGRVPRTKSAGSIIAEMDTLYQHGFRGPIDFVDDNFIGNKKAALQILPHIIQWQESHDHPYFFLTEASLNLASLPELMRLMREARFTMVFVGIESPDPNVLVKMGKKQNTQKTAENHVLNAVRTIQQGGLEVYAGIIIGADGEPSTMVSDYYRFIQKAGISVALINLLSALKGTALYDRLKSENRLLDHALSDKDFTASSIVNFRTEKDPEVLKHDFKKLYRDLYLDLNAYYERCLTLLGNKPAPPGKPKAFRPSVRKFLGLAFLFAKMFISRQGPAHLRYLYRSLRKHPTRLVESFMHVVLGYHLYRYAQSVVFEQDSAR